MNINDLLTKRTLLQREIRTRLEEIEAIENQIRHTAEVMNSAGIARECPASADGVAKVL